MRAAFPAIEARVERFYAMQHYQLGWRDEQLGPADVDPGKLLRPQLTLLACRAAGGDAQQALPLAAGIQLIHDNLEAAILLIVAASVLPMVFEYLRHRSATRTVIAETAEVVEDLRDDER